MQIFIERSSVSFLYTALILGFFTISFNPSTTSAATPNCTFTRPLTLGSQGADVACLQNFLAPLYFSRTEGTTGYFGPVTQSAVAQWQKDNGVVPATGYFGSISQSKIKSVEVVTISVEPIESVVEDPDESSERYSLGYEVNKDYIVYSRDGRDSLTMYDADVKSFKDLGNRYAKDKNHVYYKGDVMVKADPGTFKIFSKFEGADHVYAKDKKAIYLNGDMVSINLNPKTFENLTGDVIKDSKRVMYLDTTGLTKRYRTLKSVDAPTFEYVGWCSDWADHPGYFKDKNMFYVGFKARKDIDPKTFVQLGRIYLGLGDETDYARDKNYIYNDCAKVSYPIDSKTFVDLGHGFFKDKNHVWTQGQLLERNIDPNTFEVVESSWKSFTKDKNHVWYGGEIMKNVNPNDCTVETIDSCLEEGWQEPDRSDTIE